MSFSKSCHFTHKIFQVGLLAKAGVLILAVVLVSAIPKIAMAVDEMITARGILEMVVVPGGEKTGWTIKLEADLQVKQGMKVKNIDLDAQGKNLTDLDGKLVQVTGALTWRKGIERGDYPVIVAKNIRALP
jgi:hypothetical protein